MIDTVLMVKDMIVLQNKWNYFDFSMFETLFFAS